MKGQQGNFIIRIYALFIENGKILLSDEYRFNKRMTKFPGGGLHAGEGPIECLERECLEEFNQEVIVLDHFYTTDFFQKAYFYENHQLISIYYLAKFKTKIKFKIAQKPFDFEEEKEGSQSFRWESIETLQENDLTFPIDRVVLKLIKKKL